MELLVVIAIIGILASLLLPGLTHAKASAYSAKCKSNLRQIGLSLLMYVGDHSVYPRNDDAYAQWSGWAPALNGYLLQPLERNNLLSIRSQIPWWPTGVFLCPADKRTAWHGAGGSYGYNAVGVSIFGVNPSGGGYADAALEPQGLGDMVASSKRRSPPFLSQCMSHTFVFPAR